MVWLYTSMTLIPLLFTRKQKTPVKFKNIQFLKRPMMRLTRILESGNTASLPKTLKHIPQLANHNSAIQTISRALPILFKQDKDASSKLEPEDRLSTLATFNNLDLDILLVYNQIKQNLGVEMERFGEGSTLDVIMATQFSTDRTKLKLETFLKLRKMIKSDFI